MNFTTFTLGEIEGQLGFLYTLEERFVLSLQYERFSPGLYKLGYVFFVPPPPKSIGLEGLHSLWNMYTDMFLPTYDDMSNPTTPWYLEPGITLTNDCFLGKMFAVCRGDLSYEEKMSSGRFPDCTLGRYIPSLVEMVWLEILLKKLRPEQVNLGTCTHNRVTSSNAQYKKNETDHSTPLVLALAQTSPPGLSISAMSELPGSCVTAQGWRPIPRDSKGG